MTHVNTLADSVRTLYSERKKGNESAEEKVMCESVSPLKKSLKASSDSKTRNDSANPDDNVALNIKILDKNHMPCSGDVMIYLNTS